MNKADLFFRPSQRVMTHDGRILSYWGKQATKDRIHSRTLYVFFDVTTDECVELSSEQVVRLKRL